MEGKLSIRKIVIGKFCKLLFLANGTSDKEVAEKLGKSRQSLSGIMAHGRMNLGSFIDILNACGEKFVIQLKNGETYEIELKDQKDERIE